MKKFAIAATALALAASTLTAVPANAAAVPASKAVVLSECSTLNQVAKGKGADGSDLKCIKATVGSMKGKQIWQYPTLPVLSRLEMVIPNNLTSGFGGFGKAVVDALKAEGLTKTEPVLTPKPGPGNTTGLLYMIKDMAGKAGKIAVTGFAQVGGAYTAKVAYRVSDANPIARMYAEYSAIAVKADSKYRTLADLVVDLKKDAKAAPIVGGTVGGVDYYLAASMFDALGLPVSSMNYTANNGGQSAALMSDAKYAFGVSGYADFAPYVASGDLRLLAVSGPSRLPGVATKTFKEQGVNVVVENWRGLILPPNTSAAGKATVIRALDIVTKSKSYKDYLASQKAVSPFLPGTKFVTWLKGEENKIRKLYSDLGL